jgi:hypothetical protein
VSPLLKLDLNSPIAGVKKTFYPHNDGRSPHDLEMNCKGFVTLSSWNRDYNAMFCYEIFRVLQDARCHVYGVSMEKAKACDPLNSFQFVPLAYHRLLKAFNHECVTVGISGFVVSD